MNSEGFIPMVQLRPSGLVCYYDSLNSGHNPNKSHFQSSIPPTYGGIMLSKQAKRLRRCIQILVAQAKWKTAYHVKTGKPYKWKLNFVTLTLSAAQGSRSDKDLRKYVFEPFLRILRMKYGLTTYVWRCERQLNGNLHWHITGDRWLQWRYLRTDWNRCQEKLGFITQFEKAHGHRDPNSTDIHSVNQIRNLAAYLAKYMGKQEKNATPIDGKLWDASKNLKHAKFPSMVIEGDREQAVNRSVQWLHDKLFEMDFATLVIQSNHLKGRVWSPTMKTAYREWLDSIQN